MRPWGVVPVTAPAPGGPLPSSQSPLLLPQLPGPRRFPRGRAGLQMGLQSPQTRRVRHHGQSHAAWRPPWVEASSHLFLHLGKDGESLFLALKLHFFSIAAPFLSVCFVLFSFFFVVIVVGFSCGEGTG